MNTPTGRGFVTSVVIALSLVILAKVWSVINPNPAFASTEPVFLLPLRTVLVLAALLELSVVAICLFRSTVDGMLAIAWLSAIILAYRIGLWWMGWTKPCSCLGNLTDALHISPQIADNVMKGLLAFMFIGSVSLLIKHHRQGRTGGPTPNQPTPEPTQA